MYDRERLYATFFHNMAEIGALSEIVYDADANPIDWRYIEVNPAFESFAGMPREEIIGHRLTEVFGFDRIPEPFAGALRQANETRTPAYFESCVEKVNRCLFTSVSILGDGLLATISTDVTELKNRESALRRSKKRTVDILESITDAFFALDPIGRFTYLNAEAERMCQKNREDLLGRNIWEAFSETDFAEFREAYELAISTRKPQAVEQFYRRRRGWYDIRIYPSDDGATVYFRDITENKRDHKELTDALDRERGYSLLLQHALLPPAPSVGPDYRVGLAYLPAYREREIGGDFYDAFRSLNGWGGIVLGDVSGKGLEAAALAAATRSTVHAFTHESSSPADILARTNEVMCNRHPESETFVTVFLTVLDVATGAITYSSAGHPPGFVVRMDGTTEMIGHGNLPIGLICHINYREQQTMLEVGDKLVLYTDGVSEAHVGSEMLDIDGVGCLLDGRGSWTAQETADKLMDAAMCWADGKLTDDAAVVVIERLR